MPDDERPADSGDEPESDPGEQSGQPQEGPQENDTPPWDTGAEGREEGTRRQNEGTRRQDPGARPNDSGAQRQGPETRRAETGARQQSEPARSQTTGGRRQGQGAHPQDTTTRQSERPQDGGGAGAGARIERFKRLVIWPESIIVGVAVWLFGFVLHAIPLWWFDVSEENLLDGVILVYYESVGGSVFSDISAFELLTTTVAYQSALDSDAFGVAPAVHMVVPALVLLIGGHVLAGRHIKRGRARRPLESILAGASLAIWFTIVLFLAVAIADQGDASVNMGEVLVMGLLYSGVFATIGAAIRSRSALSSGWGILGGIGTAIVSFGLWFLLGNPFETITERGLLQRGILERTGPDPESFSDLEGTVETVGLFMGFVTEHGLAADTIVPAWFVIVVPLVTGAALAYVYERRDPLVGCGEGAKLGAGYVIPVFLVVVAYVGGLAQELESTHDEWPTTGPGEVGPDAVETVNTLVAVAPRSILLAGLVYPVVFAALGGAIGAFVYDTQQSSDRRTQQQSQNQQYRQEPQPGESPAGQYQQGQADQSYQQGQGQADQSYQQGQGQADQPYQQGQGQANQSYQQGQANQPYQQGQGQPPQDQSTRQSPGATDQPPQDRSDQQPPEPSTSTGGPASDEAGDGDASAGRDSSADGDTGADGDSDGDTGADGDASGEELSPGDIIGDEIDEDDAEES